MTDSTTGAPVAPSVISPALAPAAAAPALAPAAAAPALAPAAAAPAPAPAAPKAFATSLDEFCRRHSRVEPSVELLNAFRVVEARAGRTRALEADFVARLATFAARPVG